VKRLIISTFLAAIALTAPAATASAQDFNPFEIGGAAGVAIPTGDLGDIADMGYNATFFVGYNPAFLPVGLRFEAAYNEFGIDEDLADGSINIPSFTANAIFKLPTGGFTPYVIGGAGLYRVGAEDDFFGTSESDNRFGWNAGGGISMPLSGFKVFIEARFNQVMGEDGSESLTFVPIVFGASF
jgi:opacity protein-like surface antigen